MTTVPCTLMPINNVNTPHTAAATAAAAFFSFRYSCFFLLSFMVIDSNLIQGIINIANERITFLLSLCNLTLEIAMIRFFSVLIAVIRPKPIYNDKFSRKERERVFFSLALLK